MKLFTNTRWIFLLSLFLVLSLFALAKNSQAKAGFVGTQTCTDCHQTDAWLDNNPPIFDVVLNIAEDNANVDYVPLNLRASHETSPFYTIPEGYTASIHNIPSFNLTITDEVQCEGCHGKGLAHFGLGPIPRSIPDIKTCGTCHTEAHGFPFNQFLLTRHANPSKEPPKFFDQGKNGNRQAKTSSRTPGVPAKLSLLKSNQRTIVTRNERIEECSVCHNYALNYPQFVQKIAANKMPKKPTVSCGACHDAHIPSPNGFQPAVADGAVQVTAASGSTVTGVTPVEGREDFYLNHKPYKLAENGAQDTINGTWTRGSAIARPQTSVVNGVGTLSDGGTRLTFSGGGFSGKVHPLFTLFILDPASSTVNLPGDAIDFGQPVTVQATIMAGFEVEEVIDDHTLLLGSPVATSANVTYKKASGTGTLAVPIPFNGDFRFEIRDMKTNPENLCGSCHTQGKLKFSAWGKKNDGTLMDVSNTHNNDILTQYYSTGFFPPGPEEEPVKGHAARFDAPFLDFSAFEAGSHQPTYPFDMSITGSGGVGSLRNKGNTNFVLTQTPNAQNDYLVTAGNTTQYTFQSAYACYQCHNGLGAIDYMNNVQGTSDARIVWGDSTVTCWTCHDPHTSKIEANVRVPVKLSYNSLFVDSVKNPEGGIDKFMDGTDIPAGVENGKVCLFCHQGRESGLTVFLRIQAKGIDPYTDPNTVIGGLSLANPHYLDSGALLWSKNAWEFFFNNVPQQYSTGIQAHQELNCMDCHMTPATVNAETGVILGSHTWRPQIETCQKCHPGAQEIRRPLPRRAGDPATSINIPASADYDGDGVVKTAFEEIGTINDPDFGDSGLLGQLKGALQAQGIFYDPDSYPYFFNAQGGTFNQFTSNSMAAAFNLTWIFKSGTCIPYHNAPYVVQILQDSLVALGVPLGARKRPPPPVTGSRPATDYRTIVINP
jgi:hypothetical protein